MKKLSRILTVALVASAAVGLTACDSSNNEPGTVTPEVNKSMTLSQTHAELLVKDTLIITVTSTNLEGKLNITANNTNVSWSDVSDEGVVTFTANAGGETIVTFTQDGVEKKLSLIITEKEANYTLYDAAGTELKLDINNSLFYALDELLVQAATADTTFTNGSTIRNQYGDVVFTYNAGFIWNWMDSKGLTNDILPTSIIENDGVYGSFGQTSWWGSYLDDTKLYTQNSTNLISTEYIPIFNARPTEFNLAFNDGYAGYSSDPNGLYNGWLASTYRAGISVAQYAGWADSEVSTGVFFDEFNFTYDLSSGEMKPSQNPNQTTRADIWLGSSHSGVCDDMLMGVTFDAGSIDTTKDLADGTTRDWYLFNETINGVSSAVQGTRTLSTEGIATSTWDKENGVWIHDFSLTLNLVFGEDESGNFTRTLTAVPTYKNDMLNASVEPTSIVINQGAVVNIKEYRFTYGVNYTPDHTVNNRKLPDIQNGGYWTGVLQQQVEGLSNGEVVRNYDFLAGRTVNGGNQTGLYGCDVVSASLVGGKTQFDFNY